MILSELKPNPGQVPFLEDLTTSIKGCVGGFGSGKSFSAAIAFTTAMILNGYDAQGRRTYCESLICGPDYQVCSEMTKELYNIFRMFGIKWLTKVKSAQIHIVNKIGTKDQPAIIHIRSAANARNIVSINTGSCWCDEAALMPRNNVKIQDDAIEQCFLRNRSAKANKPIMILSSTPNDGKQSRFYDVFNRGLDDCKLYEMSTYDNEANLHPSYIRTLEKLYPDAKQREAYLMGKFIDFGGSVAYSCWSEKNIKNFELNPKYPVDISCDFGNPNHYLIGQELPDGTLVVCHEIAEKNLPTEDVLPIIRNLLTKTGGFDSVRIFGDAAGAWGSGISTDTHYTLLLNYFRKHNILAEQMTPHKNPRQRERVNCTNLLMRNLDGIPEYFVHERCEGLANDFQSVIWKENGKELLKGGGISDYSDAESYRCWELHPPEELPKDMSEQDLRWNI